MRFNKILVIIQRSNGDVLLSSSLVDQLKNLLHAMQIDLLVNDDTVEIAKTIPYVNNIITFSYKLKHEERWKQEKAILKKILRKYDLSINLTASDRSVLYAFFASKNSISAVEKNLKKSWWKKLLLKKYYFFDNQKHILINNLSALFLLGINPIKSVNPPYARNAIIKKVSKKLAELNLEEFLIFHPSAQYKYKIYSQSLRNQLLNLLSDSKIKIIVTGGSSLIDKELSQSLPVHKNIFNWIGKTSIEEFIALSSLSIGYIGMDTLNMHIASLQNKRIFAIFGPTNLLMWSPWSNDLQTSATKNQPIQTYGNVTIFQADLPCVACGKAGCLDNNGKSNCLDKIDPKIIFKEILGWYKNQKNDISILTETKYYDRRVVLYIVYGDDQIYYDGAKFSFLTFKYWIKENDQIEMVVLTEKPEKFEDYPIKTILMTKNQISDWSINGSYHFRIKNRGLAFVMDQLKLNDLDKIIFFDTDTYFHKSPIRLFDLITNNQALFYLNEGLIYKRKRFHTYVESLQGKIIKIDDESYQLSKKSALWGSLMVGISSNMRPSLEWSDKLLLRFFELVPAHTIEPFALSESLLKKYKIVEGKKFVSLYSTSRKKEYASSILSNFFKENRALSINQQITLAQKVKIKRSFFTILKQRFLRYFNE